MVAGITPFDSPAMVPLWMYRLAIACGNTFILKPSERDSCSTLLIADQFHEAGLPMGILNVVNGEKEAVDGLIVAPEIKALSFVDSTPIAEYIYSKGTRTHQRCALKSREYPAHQGKGQQQRKFLLRTPRPQPCFSANRRSLARRFTLPCVTASSARFTATRLASAVGGRNCAGRHVPARAGLSPEPWVSGASTTYALPA
ncbi:aldehyde dehydrogenase family protein [Aromatoleum evansii]|uniref:aldehyde dehydrogenase family protein n=1 Tax=Aromatoleum evansii TaxID=59406 RepID=UPI0030DD863D